MKKIIIVIFLILLFFSLDALDLDMIDALNHDGQYERSLMLLQSAMDKNNPDIRIIWRMSREIFELAEKIPNSKRTEKINKYSEGMAVAEPFLNISVGDKRDRANVIFFYSINFGSRGRVIGIKESIDQVPKLRELAEKSLKIDPSLGLVYLLVAKIDEELPFFLGGDKYRMGYNFNRALQYEKENMTVYYDAAKAFSDRHWDINKKSKMNSKMDYKEGSPLNLTDREYAVIILQEALKAFARINNPSAREKTQLELIKKLLSRIE